jgi:hypothetical protein
MDGLRADDQGAHIQHAIERRNNLGNWAPAGEGKIEPQELGHKALEKPPFIVDEATFVVGLRPVKAELVTYMDLVNPDFKEKVVEVEIPPAPPKVLRTIRKTLQPLIRELEMWSKEKGLTEEDQEVLRICNEVLRKIGTLEAEKALEIEKKMNGVRIEAFYTKGTVFWDDKNTAITAVKDARDAIIEILENSDLIEWLCPQRCKNTVQHSEHAETETICIGSLLDLHIHVDYEVVENDEGLAVTATVRPIHIAEASK